MGWLNALVAQPLKKYFFCGFPVSECGALKMAAKTSPSPAKFARSSDCFPESRQTLPIKILVVGKHCQLGFRFRLFSDFLVIYRHKSFWWQKLLFDTFCTFRLREKNINTFFLSRYFYNIPSFLISIKKM